MRRALERDLPLLGICRGMQILNVACGGTLHQHLPELLGHEHHRRVPGTFDGADHDVRLLPGSLAARAAGEELHATKSHHHQGVDRVGDGLQVTGWSVDRRAARGDRGAGEPLRARRPVAPRGRRAQPPDRGARRGGRRRPRRRALIQRAAPKPRTVAANCERVAVRGRTYTRSGPTDPSHGHDGQAPRGRPAGARRGSGRPRRGDAPRRSDAAHAAAVRRARHLDRRVSVLRPAEARRLRAEPREDRRRRRVVVPRRVRLHGRVVRGLRGDVPRRLHQRGVADRPARQLPDHDGRPRRDAPVRRRWRGRDRADGVGAAARRDGPPQGRRQDARVPDPDVRRLHGGARDRRLRPVPRRLPRAPRRSRSRSSRRSSG